MDDQIKSIFKNHPSQDVVYTTVDGMPFFETPFAEAHCQKFKDKTIKEHHRGGTSKVYDPAAEQEAPHAALDPEVKAEADAKKAEKAAAKKAEKKAKAKAEAEKKAQRKEAAEKAAEKAKAEIAAEKAAKQAEEKKAQAKNKKPKTKN